MATIRTRLTVAYAVALAATMAVYSWALYQMRAAQSEEPLRRLMVSQADLAIRVLQQGARTGPVVVPEPDPFDPTIARPRLRTDVAQQLDLLPHYLVVLDTADWRVYSSPEANRLAVMPADTSDAERLAEYRAGLVEYGTLLDAARQLTATQRDAKHVIAGDVVRLVGRFVQPEGTPIDRIVVGYPNDVLGTRSQQELLGAIVILAPLILVLSVVGASLIAGNVFAPMQRLASDLEAITDGRSLHRRLPVDERGDEVARLTVTLNAMLGRLENYFGALRRFTADASHELKTPLAVLRADVERAMHANTSPGERLVALEEALHETTRMADLVDQLLTLARADEGRFDVHREPVPLAPLVRDVFETAVILGEAAGLHVAMPACDDATVMGDRTRLRQLFLNLVTNAIKYTPRGGEVEVALRRAGDVATLAVRDTGIGIAAADLPYIFDRFWRADRVRSRSGERGGFGLGLAISQWIAQAHGGTLTASSRLTRGSVFTVTLPIAPEGATAEYPVVVAPRPDLSLPPAPEEEPAGEPGREPSRVW